MPAAKVKRNSSSRRRQRTSRTSIGAPRAALSEATNLTASSSLAGVHDRSSPSPAEVTVGEEEDEMVLQRLVEVGSDGMHNVHQPVNSGPRCYTVRAPSHHHNSTTITRRYTTTTSHFATTNHTTSSPDPSYTSLNPLHDLTTSLSHLTDKDDAPSITSLPPPPPTLGARRGVDPSYSDELNPAGSRAAHGQSDSHGQGHLSPSIIDRVAAADQSGHGQDTGDRRASLPSTSPFITHPNNSTPHAAVHIPAGARPLDTYLQPLLGQPLLAAAQ
jgi:hypothetical protein